MLQGISTNLDPVIGTFILGLVYSAVYLKQRNLYVPGLYHGWLADSIIELFDDYESLHLLLIPDLNIIRPGMRLTGEDVILFHFLIGKSLSFIHVN